jgi:hypothetical protein
MFKRFISTFTDKLYNYIFFLFTFNAPCMGLKIRCDGWQRKYFGKWTGPMYSWYGSSLVRRQCIRSSLSSVSEIWRDHLLIRRQLRAGFHSLAEALIHQQLGHHGSINIISWPISSHRPLVRDTHAPCICSSISSMPPSFSVSSKLVVVPIY